jgi:hypothetical protein
MVDVVDVVEPVTKFMEVLREKQRKSKGGGEGGGSSKGKAGWRS